MASVSSILNMELLAMMETGNEVNHMAMANPTTLIMNARMKASSTRVLRRAVGRSHTEI